MARVMDCVDAAEVRRQLFNTICIDGYTRYETIDAVVSDDMLAAARRRLARRHVDTSNNRTACDAA